MGKSLYLILLLSPETPLCLNLCRSSACCHCLCVSVCSSALLWWVLESSITSDSLIHINPWAMKALLQSVSLSAHFLVGHLFLTYTILQEEAFLMSIDWCAAIMYSNMPLGVMLCSCIRVIIVNFHQGLSSLRFWLLYQWHLWVKSGVSLKTIRSG